MYHIAICIATYKRPLMLEKLILSVEQCNIDKNIIKDVDIIVMDNDALKSGEQIILGLKKKLKSLFELHYFNYPLKGIANVRNELIKKANTFNPDFLVFIDDDEYVTSEWLNELVTTVTINNSDAARGPVFAVLEPKVPKSIGYWFKRENYPDNTKLNNFTTGNLILKTTKLLEYNIWFDERFNFSGSEDYYFGLQMIKKGALIFWSARAITYENIPKNRATLTWLIKRRFRTAGTFTYILKTEQQYFKLIIKLLISVYFIFFGMISIIIFSPFKFRYWGILKVTEGIGSIGGLLNIRFKEYK